ncbi:MAG: cytochrome P450 [Oligoflexus sp.]
MPGGRSRDEFYACIGKLFAYMEVKAFMYQFLQKFKVSLPQGYRSTQNIDPIPKPAHGLPIFLLTYLEV